MKKNIVIFIILFAIVFGADYAYGVYNSLTKGNCTQVVVRATSRITGITKEFANPCIVPFWYKNIHGF
jgi:hypothetical protein